MQNLSPLPQSFVTALNSRNWRGVEELFTDGGGLLDCGSEYRGKAISAWGRQHFQGDGFPIQVIEVWHRDHKIILTVLVPEIDDPIAGPAPSQFDLEFTIVEGGISQVKVLRDSPSGLPAPVVGFVSAVNRFDLDSLVEAFAEDALVNDQLQEHWGHISIRRWAARDIVGQRLTMRVLKVFNHHENIILTAHVSGEYDKRGLPDPLVLTFYFCLSCRSIVQLLIIQNYPVEGRGD